MSVVRPTQATGGRSVTLPGDLAAFNAANIFARTTGYIRSWYDDIGAAVRPGQVLAVLDTPDLDQQVIQARADLASAQANRRLSQSTADRWVDLLKSDAVSKQETDEKTGDLAVKGALVNAAQANLDRLLALKSFARITAPFAGIVTARNANIGDLVTAGASGAQPLFNGVGRAPHSGIRARTAEPVGRPEARRDGGASPAGVPRPRLPGEAGEHFWRHQRPIGRPSRRARRRQPRQRFEARGLRPG